MAWVSYVRTKGIKQTHNNNHYNELSSLSKEWVIFAGLDERHSLRSCIRRALDLCTGTRSSLHLQHWNYHYRSKVKHSQVDWSARTCIRTAHVKTLLSHRPLKAVQHTTEGRMTCCNTLHFLVRRASIATILTCFPTTPVLFSIDLKTGRALTWGPKGNIHSYSI